MLSVRARLINGLLHLARRSGLQASFTIAANDPIARDRLITRARRADRREPPRRLAKKRAHQRIDINGAPLHLLAHPHQPGQRVVLHLHGGGYFMGPNRPHWSAMAEVTAEAGADLAMHIYPRSPEHSSEEIISSVVAAYTHLVERYGADNIVVAGDSAGGGLALSLLVSVRDQGGPQPHAAILISPWLDLAASDPATPELSKKDLMLTIAGIRGIGKIYARDRDPSDPEISPLYASIADLAPIHIFVGTHELFLTDCRAFVAKARANAHPMTIREIPNGQHVTPILPTPEGKRARAQIVALTGWP